MKKILILLILIITATGCEAQYNLTITKDTMEESVDFLYANNKDNQKIINKYLKNNYMAYYDMDNRTTNNYKLEEIKDNDKIGINFNYTYNKNTLQKSSLLDMCYYQKTVTKTDDEIILTTDGKTTCFYKDNEKLLDKLTINIKTDLKVKENNADKVKNNVYTWIIDNNNFQNKPINMVIDLKNTNGLSFGQIALLSLLTIVIISIIILLYIYIKNHKNNKL